MLLTICWQRKILLSSQGQSTLLSMCHLPPHPCRQVQAVRHPLLRKHLPSKQLLTLLRSLCKSQPDSCPSTCRAPCANPSRIPAQTPAALPAQIPARIPEQAPGTAPETAAIRSKHLPLLRSLCKSQPGFRSKHLPLLRSLRKSQPRFRSKHLPLLRSLCKSQPDCCASTCRSCAPCANPSRDC